MSNSLQNSNNYNINLKETSKYIFSKYINIINEYIKLFFENVKILDKTYYLYIFKKGLECISHIFNMLLLYTNNLEITKMYSEKSYYYYVEFISQIENTNNNFLQLNSKDASLFIYKKTIFDINNDIKKNFTLNINNKIKIKNCKLLINIYNSLILNNFNKYSNNLNDIINYLSKSMNKILNLYDNNENLYYDNIDIIYLFINKFMTNNTNYCKNICQYIDLLINKLKNLSKKEKIKNNIITIDYTIFDSYTPNKFIDYISDR